MSAALSALRAIRFYHSCLPTVWTAFSVFIEQMHSVAAGASDEHWWGVSIVIILGHRKGVMARVFCLYS